MVKKCSHGVNRDKDWCEPCFRKEQRKRWGYSPYDSRAEAENIASQPSGETR